MAKWALAFITPCRNNLEGTQYLESSSGDSQLHSDSQDMFHILDLHRRKLMKTSVPCETILALL